jgi:hypothetical protein
MLSATLSAVVPAAMQHVVSVIRSKCRKLCCSTTAAQSKPSCTYEAWLLLVLKQMLKQGCKVARCCIVPHRSCWRATP